MSDLQHLFKPIQIGNVTLPNRVVLLPMALGYAFCGKPTPRLIRFLEERAIGGCGAICTPFSIFPAGDTFFGYMGLDASNDEYIGPSRILADSIHDCGVPIIGQLNTLTVWRKDRNCQLEIVGPSAFSARPKGHMPRELTIDEIKTYIKQHGQAARRLREAGYDAVEVMGGIGNIISRFTSPLANQRKDQYGGSFENRLRLPLEIIEEIKREAGEDYTILWRYSGHEYLPGGYEVEGAIEIGRELTQAGVQWLNIQVGWHDSPIPLITKEVPQGGFSHLAGDIRKEIDIPVVTSYRITDPVMADNIIASGQADLIGLARALISDPGWALKAKQGKYDDINRCICCCRCVDQTVGAGKGLEICSVNARIGEDIGTDIQQTDKIKRVFVVGAGPAGMEAARVCALRGHHVALFEKSDRLGGMLNVAKLPPDKFEIGYLQDYLENQVRTAGVDIYTDVSATSATVQKGQPDVLIVATGSDVSIPDIRGIDNKNVFTAIDILSGARLEGNMVVVIGGGLIGCEVALYLAYSGKQVTIIEMLPKIGIDIGASERFVTINKLKANGIRLEAGASVTEVANGRVMIDRAGEKSTIEADYVVIAAGMSGNDSFVNALKCSVQETYAIGDCVEPRRIGEAIKEAFRIGIRI